MSDNGLNIMTEFFRQITKEIRDKKPLIDIDFKKRLEYSPPDLRKEEENPLSDTDFKKMLELELPNPRKETVKPELDSKLPGFPPQGVSEFRSSIRSIPEFTPEHKYDSSQNLSSSLQPNIITEAQEVLKKAYTRKIRRKINEAWAKIPIPPLYF